MAQVKVNSNFHNLSQTSVFDARLRDGRFKEYRRRWHDYPSRFIAGEFPLFIDIEATSACNLKCPFCATTFKSGSIKNGFMTFDILKKLIDEGADNNLYGVKFNIRGEPLLHPEIDKFVGYAKKKALIDVYFNTNGLLLNEEMSMKLIDSGLDRISISFEGHTKEIYERHRPGSNYETVLKNIEYLQLLKGKLNTANPRVRVQAVMMPDIKPVLEEYKKFWADRVEEVAFLDYKEMKAKKKGVRYPWACPQVWQRMAVWWDGTILPCNHDDDGLIAIGNIKDMTISQAWRSENLSRIRLAHKEGRAHEIPACDGCYLRDSEINKLVEGGY